MLARIRWPNVAAAVLVAVVLLAVVAWPALEPAPPHLPPGPATAIRPPTPTPAPTRVAQPVPRGFERRDRLVDTKRAGGSAGARAYVPEPPPQGPRPPAPLPTATAAPITYAPAPAYAPPAHREFSTFER